MRINADTCLVGARTVLVPYEAHHVDKYHDWMGSAALQEQTASERLTLEEERAMQVSWREDEDKLTFIVLDAGKLTGAENRAAGEIAAMAGDVNLFFNIPLEDDPKAAEIEVMIAEESCRGKGLGREAVVTLMLYGIDHLNVTKYISRIGMDNATSMSLFEKLGFVKVSESQVFKEITFEWVVAQQSDKLADFRHLVSETKEECYRAYMSGVS